ncbi:MAG: peptidoglycan binding protein CsiV, partial [Gammaproteobacteria bacterium]|nr:peptidoglycan binding protein CsiV [Gammaproteobacteria bacterium]
MKVKILLVFLLPAMQAAAVNAQALPDESLPEVRRYAVEIIVFRYAENVSVGSEVFPPDEVEILDEAADFETDSEQELTIQEAADADEAGDIDYSGVDLRPVIMRRDELTMQETVSRMRRLDVYDPIMHIGWVQPMLPDAIPDALPLARFGTPPAGLEGEFTLYLGRYLHLVVDLAMETRNSPTSNIEAAPRRYGDERRQFDTMASGKTYYRISENRIVKYGVLRYYEHPKFGVLAIVT